MTCQELINFLLDYDANDLPPPVRAEFDRHLGLCPPCVNYLQSYRRTVTMVKEACCEPDSPVPQDVPEELVKAILEARARGQ